MEKKPYSDRRWWEASAGIDSQCGDCIHWHGFGVCDCYSPLVPEELMAQSFPGTENYKEDYCPYREMKEDQK